MATVVIMPKQGQSVESCILTEIRKKKGDTVEVGDILFAYETDKAAFEEEAKVAGTVLEVFFNEGDEIPVLVNVMVIGNPGESYSISETGNPKLETPNPKPETRNSKSSAEVIPPSFPPHSSAEVVPPSFYSSEVVPPPISPRANRLAEKHAIQASQLSGTGPHGRVIERDVQAVIDAMPKTTPLAKAIIKKDARLLPDAGSGLAGMVRGADLDISKQSAVATEARAAVKVAEATEASKVSEASKATLTADAQVIPLTNIRKLIAKAMHASLQNSAQLTHHLSADARRILSLRKKVKAAVASGGYPTDISLNDMICRATVLALQKYPQANAHFMGDSIRRFAKVHLAIAVDTERGLMVPAVRNAGELSIEELSIRLKDVAGACKKGSIDPDLLSSEAASFTISNLGNYGVEMFTPIINLPQVAILGVNTIVPRPKETGDGTFEIVPYLGLSLTYDHRALDGGEATRFLKQIATEIETLDFEII